MAEVQISGLTSTLTDLANGDYIPVDEDQGGGSSYVTKKYDATPLVDAITKKHTRSHSMNGADDHASMTADRIIGRISTAGTPQELTASQVATLVKSLVLTDPAFTGVPLEDIYTISDAAAFEIDPSNGGQQGVTLGASRTPKGTNFQNGESVTLFVNDGTDYTLTWTDTTFGTSGVEWKTDGGTAPTLNTTGYTVILLAKFGGQVYGWRCGDN
jgi:hypothetical protein